MTGREKQTYVVDMGYDIFRFPVIVFASSKEEAEMLARKHVADNLRMYYEPVVYEE